MLTLFHHRATEDTERKEKTVDKKNELSYSKYEDKKC